MTVEITYNQVTAREGDTISSTLQSICANTGTFSQGLTSGSLPPDIWIGGTSSNRTVTGTFTKAGTYYTKHDGQYTDPTITWIVEPESMTEVVEVVDPVFDDYADQYTIPAVTGVRYLVDGAAKAAGTHSRSPLATSVTVTAELVETPRYVWPAGTVDPVQWSHDWPVETVSPVVGMKSRVTIAELVPTDIRQRYEFASFELGEPSTVPGMAAAGPTSASLRWENLTGTPTAADTYRLTVQAMEVGSAVWTGEVTLTVRATADDPVPPVEPEPEPETPPVEPEPETPPVEEEPVDDWMESCAERAVTYIGRRVLQADGTPSKHLTTARVQAPLVAAFVEGYTRGKGFNDGVPVAQLQAVIVSALSRLVQNPEQVDYYSVGDYSEKGAKFVGFTLPELYILNRYRKLWA